MALGWGELVPMRAMQKEVTWAAGRLDKGNMKGESVRNDSYETRDNET